MRATMLMIISAALCALPAMAQAPIPRALLAAKTAYMVNEGASQKHFDGLANELKKWGRWTLVDDQSAADITITLRGLAAYRGWPMIITDTQTHAQLWSDRQKNPNFWTGAEVPLVRHLREALEGKPKKKD